MKLTCTSTRRQDSDKCTWIGKAKDCKQIRDYDFNGNWYVYFNCPICGSTVAEVNFKTPLNHPLKDYCK